MKSGLHYLIVFFLFYSCDNQENSSEKRDYQVRLEKANDQMLNQGNVDYADSVFASQYRGAGPDMIKGFATNLRTAFPDLDVSVETKVADPGIYAWIRTHTGTHTAPIMGYMPINNEITWKSVVISEEDENGMISNEWGYSNLVEQLEQESADGVYTYIAPVEGHAIIKGDKFIWSFTDTETNEQFSEYGTMVYEDGMLNYTIEHSNRPERVDVTFKTRMLTQEGDTIKWNFVDANGEITGMGQALKDVE